MGVRVVPLRCASRVERVASDDARLWRLLLCDGAVAGRSAAVPIAPHVRTPPVYTQRLPLPDDTVCFIYCSSCAYTHMHTAVATARLCVERLIHAITVWEEVV